jgi:hypothetical protein
MATFKQVDRLLFVVLPIADVCAIVREYTTHFKKEWTKNLMCAIREQIDETAEYCPTHNNRHYMVRRFVRLTKMRLLSRLYVQRSALLNEIDESPHRHARPSARHVAIHLYKFGVLKKKVSFDRCAFCLRKSDELTFVHRLERESAHMCRSCDTEKKYTVATRGFRSLPNKVQRFVVDGLNDGIKLLAICRMMYARRMAPNVSYAMLLCWMKRGDMD